MSSWRSMVRDLSNEIYETIVVDMVFEMLRRLGVSKVEIDIFVCSRYRERLNGQ